MKIIYSIPYFVWLIASIFFFSIGDFLSKKFILSPSTNYFILLIIAYSTSSILWLPALMQKNILSVTGVIWTVLSLLPPLLIGIIYFKEPFRRSIIALRSFTIEVSTHKSRKHRYHIFSEEFTIFF